MNNGKRAKEKEQNAQMMHHVTKKKPHKKPLSRLLSSFSVVHFLH